LREGSVVAFFEQQADLVLDFAGTGGGVVEDESQTFRCTQSCIIRRQAGRPVALRVSPDAATVSFALSGGCSGLPCNTAAPAHIQISFTRGRRLTASVAGEGTGSIALNGSPFCPGRCTALVAPDVPLRLTATAGDDYSVFEGFSGACTGSGECLLDAGEGDVAVGGQFGSVLLWTRSFPVYQSTWQSSLGLALEANRDGIIISGSSSAGIDIDGRAYRPSSAGPNNGLAVLFALGWDAGVRWVVPLYDFDGGVPGSDINDIATLPNGDVIAVGSCLGGPVMGRSCEGNATYRTESLMVRIRDGGLDDVQVRMPSNGGGSILGNSGLFTQVLVLDGGVLILGNEGYAAPRGTSVWSLDSSGLGVEPTATLPLAGGGLTGVPLCSWNDGLVCSRFAIGDVDANGCVSSSADASIDDLLVRLTPTLECSVIERLAGTVGPSPVAVFAPATSAMTRAQPGRPLVIAGETATAAVAMNSGLSLPGRSTWLARLGSSGVSAFWYQPHALNELSLPSGLQWASKGLVWVGETRSANTPFFGRTVSPATAIVATFDEADLGRLTRLLELRRSTLSNSAASLSIWEGKVVVVALGQDLHLGSRALSPDSLERIHVLVFRE
jgi:hypothetical protein